jgi:hypothetical protein
MFAMPWSVYTDVGGKNLIYSVALRGCVSANLLQRIDAAKTNIFRVAAELINRPRESLGDLPSFGEIKLFLVFFSSLLELFPTDCQLPECEVRA